MKRQIIISGDFTVTEIKPTKAQQRIDALRASGVSVDNFFAMGDNMIIKVVDGIPSMVDDDDPIFQEISDGGYIGHYKLFRRWVMAQMFRILRRMELYQCDMTRVINFHGYEYEWRMLEKEFLDQYKMHKHGDTECFLERNAWFDKYTAEGMARFYLINLRDYVAHVRTRTTKNKEEYKVIAGKRIPLNTIDKTFYAPIKDAITDIKYSSTPKELYDAVCHFNKVRHHFRNGYTPKMDDAFIDAYKGAGGYFTCKNLILFHGCRVHKGTTVLSQEESLAELASINKTYSVEIEGWRMIGFMKQLILDNNISVNGKIAEWRK